MFAVGNRSKVLQSMVPQFLAGHNGGSLDLRCAGQSRRQRLTGAISWQIGCQGKAIKSGFENALVIINPFGVPVCGRKLMAFLSPYASMNALLEYDLVG